MSQAVAAPTLNPRLKTAIAHHQHGKLDEAEKIYLQILKETPNDPSALQLMGLVHAARGNHEDAISFMQKSLELNPNQPVVYTNLGMLLHSIRRYAEAEKLLLQLLAHAPDHALAHLQLGLARQSMGRMEEAKASYLAAAELNPKLADAHYHLGCIYQVQNQVEQAIIKFREALAVKPNMAAAHYRLSAALVTRNELREAEVHARLSVEHAPNDAQSHQALGFALRKQERFEEARVHLEKAVELKPDFTGAYLNLANTYKDLGSLAKAKQANLKAIELNPDFAEAYNNIGSIYLFEGDKKAAEASFRKAIELAPAFGHAYRQLALNITVKAGDSLIATMEEIYARPGLTEDSCMSIAFALAKAYEDTKQYEKVFPCLHVANALRRKSYPHYSIAWAQDKYATMRKAFSADLLANAPSSHIEDATPIFIIGMPRSGSTLIEQILASHPDVHGGDELLFMQEAARESKALTGQSFPACAPLLTGEHLQILGNHYLGRLKQLAPGKKHITDKLPSNFQYVGLIHMMLPNAKIIHSMRDPMDTCLSIYKYYFSGPQPFAYNMEELAHHYRRYEETMEHWQKTLPGFVHDVKYETLVENQEEETRKLLAFCGLKWNDACLEFHKSTREVKTASVMQVRQPIYKTAMHSWEPYRKEMEPIAWILGLKI